MHDAPAAGRTGGTTRSPKRVRSARGETSSAPGPGTQAGRLAGVKGLRGHRAVGASPLHRQRLPGPNRQETPTGAAVAPPHPLCLQLLRRVLHDYSLRPPSPNACDYCGANSPAHSVLFHPSPFHFLLFHPIPAHSPPSSPRPSGETAPPDAAVAAAERKLLSLRLASFPLRLGRPRAAGSRLEKAEKDAAGASGCGG